jgi:hypothetical protein
VEPVLLYRQVERDLLLLYSRLAMPGTVDKQDILHMAEEAEKESLFFAPAANHAGNIVGRADKARQLVRALAGAASLGNCTYCCGWSGKFCMPRCTALQRPPSA